MVFKWTTLDSVQTLDEREHNMRPTAKRFGRRFPKNDEFNIVIDGLKIEQ
ncbi:MAG: hypothetical protein GWP91_22555 [Rhodobacterales bacterium]|nr:hypothetical protein [Rhodobacterales bacterium]